MKRILIFFAVFILVAAAWIGLTLNRPHQGFSKEQFVDFPYGTGTLEVARRLADAGVVPSRWHLLAVRALRPGQLWQAGEYRFHQPATTWEVADRLGRGDIYLIELRIPEGHNIYDIASLFEQMGFGEASAFLRAARDPALIADIAPQAPSLEGFLFPSTYHIPRKTSAKSLCRLLTNQFRKEWIAIGGGANALAAVTLASLVEKETGVTEERPAVASVYHNRLRQGMKLEADPTTIYAAMLEGVWRGTIYRSDLQRVHPYNTYAVAGLPPGPIANPGRASLEAALNPAPSEFLFFVAKGDGTGGHTFSRTYAEHARAVEAWRRGRLM